MFLTFDYCCPDFGWVNLYICVGILSYIGGLEHASQQLGILSLVVLVLEVGS